MLNAKQIHAAYKSQDMRNQRRRILEHESASRYLLNLGDYREPHRETDPDVIAMYRRLAREYPELWSVSDNGDGSITVTELMPECN